ncbi:hypothetical protein [Gellertiella hungarica]|uniref:Uncharacterized protein n=1 Tax=Gellertiella hungarica TaxID=1572859 RepID=A0A7W6NM93_9HYPH|nr:hypothetical protein [Gellertiella hungarica]MBB4066713.1 hypothetical protein [Gellertiella hungarica]
MVPKVANTPDGKGEVRERIAYVEHMLAQLAVVARAEREDMLGYLIDMAYEEARDVSRRSR